MNAVPKGLRGVVFYGGGFLWTFLLFIFAWVGIVDGHPFVGWPALTLLIGYGWFWIKGTFADVSMDSGEEDHGEYHWVPADSDEGELA